MVRNSLPVSDIKIYNTDAHPPATQTHAHIHYPHPEYSLSHWLLQIYPPPHPPLLCILRFLASTHCEKLSPATRPSQCNWGKKLWKCLCVYIMEVSERLRPRSSPIFFFKCITTPGQKKKNPTRGGKTTQAPFASLTMGHVRVSC